MTSKAIEVKVKIGDNEFTGNGSMEVYSVDDILGLMQTNPDKVVKTYNAAVEQAARAAIRNEVVAKNGAPDRALAKTAKQIFEARKVLGKAITMDKATELAKSMLAAA